MTNKDIAELTTRILEAAVTNEKMPYQLAEICQGYEEIFNTIKKMDQGTSTID